MNYINSNLPRLTGFIHNVYRATAPFKATNLNIGFYSGLLISICCVAYACFKQFKIRKASNLLTKINLIDQKFDLPLFQCLTLKNEFEIVISQLHDREKINEAFKTLNALKARTNTDISKETLRKIERALIIADLEDWQKDPNCKGEKKIASKQILDAFDNKKTLLDFHKNEFQTCDLNSLPISIGQLGQLKELFLARNMLHSLPDWIGNLVHLERLWLGFNQLQSLPDCIGKLVKLEDLDLWFNKLQSLPNTIGECVELRTLHLSGNQNLRDLPMSLGNLRHMTHLNVGRTAVDRNVRDAIHAQWKATHRENAAQELSLRLRTWQAIAGTHYDFSNIADQVDIGQVNEWLLRLEKTKDFRSKRCSLQSTVAKIALDLLQGALNNAEFKYLFMAHLRSNDDGCEDRAAMSLNELYTGWKMTSLDKDAPLSDKLKVLISGAKTNALRALIAKAISNHGKETQHIEQESVEIFLFYEITLKDQLGLLSAMETMSYARIGKRDWIKQKDLCEQVNATYEDHLIQLDAFKALMEKDDEFKTMWEPSADRYKVQQKALTKNSQNMRDADYKEQLESLLAQRESEKNDIAKQWLHIQLKGRTAQARPK